MPKIAVWSSAAWEELARQERRKLVAEELRTQGKTQEEVGAIVGVDQSTISDWEKASNMENQKACPPDLRVSIPKKEQQPIVDRLTAGETQEQIAADYQVMRSASDPDLVAELEAAGYPVQRPGPGKPVRV